jgi:hypothetical protein
MKKTRDNKNETIIMTRITQQILLNKHSKHFTLFYNNYECDTTNDETSLISVSELAEGDLDKLLKSSEFFNNVDDVDDVVDILYNILVQCIVSLGTFHNFGYIHQDSFLKNFLYQTNKDYKKGYYKYKYDNDTIFYIKSCRYNIMLNDFGFSKLPFNLGFSSITLLKSQLADDMLRILRNIRGDNNIFFSEKKTHEKLKQFIQKVDEIYNYIKSDVTTYNFINLLNKLYELVPPEILSNDNVKTGSIKILNDQIFDMTIKDITIKDTDIK